MEKKVVIVGAGALGSHLAALLRNEASLRLVDFDKVEKANVLSQFHASSNVGRNKALSLQQSLRFLFGTKTEAFPHRLTEGNVREMLSGADLVVDCVDDGDTRHIIRTYCTILATPCLHGALAAGGEMGRVVWSDKFSVDHAEPGAATCEDGRHLPFISVVASYLAMVSQVFLREGRKRSLQVAASGQVLLI